MDKDRPAVGRLAPMQATRVIVFRPLLYVTLELAPGIGAEEATHVAVASWSAALSGTDEMGDPAIADWWAADLHEVAEVVSVELQGAAWAADTTYGAA